ncbi:MAG: outer membrane protein assembly factor BamA [Burkholderiales bacterium]|nr:outer membrane protein assembly factor BamA [Burkholderiales bacterium]
MRLPRQLCRWFVPLFLAVLAVPAFAQGFAPFVIRDIRVEGVQRTEAGTVFSYLPVKVGERMTEERASQAIRALFATGFFKDVRIEVEGDVLIVVIEERPAIAQVDFIGLKAFERDAVRKAVREVGLAEGRIFDRAVLDRAEQELKRQYLTRGLYGVAITTTVTPLDRNRVGINFTVEEGEVAKIRKINIVGASAFREAVLLDEFELSEGGWFSWYTKDNQYSRQKLTADLEALRSFYLNRGYLEFAVESTQVSITPDKKDIYITIGITEGKRFTVSEIKFAGDLVVAEADLRRLLEIKPGDVFNGERLSASTKKIQDRLGNEGYAFANANAAPQLDRDKQTVSFTVYVDPGRRVYVRRINVAGNTRTRDEVVRREMRQLEGSYYDGEKIAESRKRLERLNYFKETSIETPPVAGAADQVDVNVKIEEKPTGQLLLGAGFSSADKLVLSTSISQQNIFGSGKFISASVSTGRTNKIYSLSHNDPYFTVDGVSRAFDIYHRDFNAANVNLGDYRTSSTGGGVRFGYPYTSIDTLVFGIAADYTQFSLGALAPPRLLNYVNTYSSTVATLPGTLAWFRDTRDSAVFPRSGRFQNASAEIGLPGGNVQYWRLNYVQRWYYPVAKNYTIYLRGEVGVGEGIGKPLPFNKRFYGGGIGSVRGFDTNSLGPRDTDGSILGGTRRFTATAEFLFPFPGLEKDRSVRLAAFTDFGQVSGGDGVTASGPVRYSVGVGLDWQSPFGPLRISWALPLNLQPNDRTQRLQFTAGTTF